jgi:hypothetical protein
MAPKPAISAHQPSQPLQADGLQIWIHPGVSSQEKELMDYKNGLGLKWGFVVSLLFGTFASLRADVDPRYIAVMVSADVQTAPARINLHWDVDPQASGYSISRRGDGSWSDVGSVGGNVNSWSDSNVSVGGTYEYRVVKSTSAGYTGVGFLLSGINAPLKDSLGKVILLVDNTYSSALSAELSRMQWDLAGDGWTVLRHDVSRNDSVVNIKEIIKADYYSDPSAVKAVFIFGHVPVPYSGNINPDGHPDHLGAWPADAYYGDMDGSWTDNSVSSGGASKPWNSNAPGDGKFDQSSLPSNVEAAVGRVDFYNMTCYANKTPSRSELDLLRAYLNKDHNFRHRVFTVARRGLVCDNFGSVYGEAFASSGWRNFGSFFGADNVTSVGYGQYFPTLSQQDYLWSYGTGGGSFYTCNGIGGSDDFATTDIRSVFTMFLGSYFGDWDNESNFLRASLGSGYCLTTSWAGRPHWFYHHMGLGETIGRSTIASQNNEYLSVYPGVDRYTGLPHVALLGDPTLRMHPVLPPSSLQGNASGSTISLSWNGSGDTDLQGYHVYRGSGPGGQFVRLTSSPISSTSFTDSAYSAGSTYMVRAVKLERSGSGTYFNASQGVFFPANGSAGGGGGGGTSGGGTVLPQTPGAPGDLVAVATTASQVDISWRDNSSNESGFRVDRKLGSSGVWAQVAMVDANTTGYSSTGLSPGSTYYFRVFAVNGSGNSMPSNESGATTALPNPATPGATFLGSDPNTRGDWRGVLGSDGFNVMSAGSSYPGYATVNAVGTTDYQWSDHTSDLRALDNPAGGNRIIGCWFAANSFTVDINLLDGMAHKLSLYFDDWDQQSRTEKIEILDALSGAVLDARSISSFEESIYLKWNVKGQIRVRLTNVSGPNVLLNALFFDPLETVSGTSASGGLIEGNFQLEVSGKTGQKFDIYTSNDLVTWTKISSVTLSSSTYNFTDSTSQGQSRRFYRAVAVP